MNAITAQTERQPRGTGWQRLGAALVLGGAAAALAYALKSEDRRPLRRPRLRREGRQLTNIALGIGSMLASSLVQKHGLRPLLYHDAGRYGLVRHLPRGLRAPAAFLLLDWAMYWWHRATHEIDGLWRLHRVHHVDLDLDMSTAVRFHAADQLVSAPMRAAMIVIIGPDARTDARWNGWFLANVLFHHANIRLPLAWERGLAAVLTTPRMHGIHHMARRDATDSNWSSGFSLWDRIHGSFRLDIPADAIRIGVAGYPDDLIAAKALALPLRSTEADW
ncbi:sterol desaturase family protein [Pacificimonas sp. WHA3]|uniref:Sterol desaturase family protein n=1 Tax=Pacificimonas pallii TaxID=2827236 RepID=A0ABS6SDL8_9SPHN|nr:sterol desaturase family protein [Pacificimonas pallii]MBV7256474.1 sterol desaturase family protein [Pacificimonas pallii]